MWILLLPGLKTSHIYVNNSYSWTLRIFSMLTIDRPGKCYIKSLLKSYLYILYYIVYLYECNITSA